MKVLFITHKYPPAVGGMEKQSFELIQRYSNAHESIVLAHEGKESVAMFFLKLRSRVHRLLSEHADIDVIHLNDGLMAAFFMALGVKTNKKIVVTYHGLDVVFPLPIYQKWVLPKVKKYDAFICVSNATRNECIQRGFDPDKIFTVVNGVDVDKVMETNETDIILSEMKKHDISSTDKIILAIGRPVKRKGFSWFAEQVLPLLPPEFKYVHIGHIKDEDRAWTKYAPKRLVKLSQLFLGSTNDATRLQALSMDPAYKDKLKLVGRIDDDFKNYLIQQASVVIMPNIVDPGDMEGFGLVALEASIAGKKVLASGIEGITDAIHHGQNGFQIATGDVTAWRDAIITHTQDATKFDPTVRQYTIDHFSWDKMISGYHEVFEGVRQ